MTEKHSLETIFLKSLEFENADQRAAFINEACGTDHDLRTEIERLLNSHEEAGSFLDNETPELLATEYSSASRNASVIQAMKRILGESHCIALRDEEQPEPAQRISSKEIPMAPDNGRYQLQGEIARGGMGAIIKGRDTDLGRDLAVKVLLDSHKDKPDVVQRFVEEAQIGGQLQHPGIAPVYELGQFEDQRPFFTMKLVKGKTLAALLESRKSSDDDRSRFLGIFEQVCQTMAYAHSRGVIHRDLKPANIMVGAFGEVQVMDWGLAKVLAAGGIADEERATKAQNVSIIETLRSSKDETPFGADSQTQMGSVMGTPAYMPPEQASGDVDLLDERSDVFGLGAILCEILTGKPPYVSDDGRELLRMARQADLDDCQQRLNACDADRKLIELTNQCVDPKPANRPRDAGEISELITAHLESVAARLKQAEVRRKLTYAVAAMIVFVIAGLGIGGVWLQAKETEAAKQVALAEGKRVEEQKVANEELQQVLYASKMQLASEQIDNGDVVAAATILHAQIPAAGELDRRGFEWHYLKSHCWMPESVGHAEWLIKDKISYRRDRGGPDANWYSSDWRRVLKCVIVAEDENQFRRKLFVVDTKSGSEIWSAEIDHAVDQQALMLISGDGQKVSCVLSTTMEKKGTDIQIHLWDLSHDKHNQAEWHVPTQGKTHNWEPTLSQNGQFLAVRFDHAPGDSPWDSTFIVWDFDTPEPIRVVEMDERTDYWLTPDGDRFLSFSASLAGPFSKVSDDPPEKVGRLRLFETRTGKEIYEVQVEPHQALQEPTFSPDGKRLAFVGWNTSLISSPGQDMSLFIWDARTGNRLVCVASMTDGPVLAHFSPDGYTICLSSGEVFDSRNGASLGKLARFGHQYDNGKLPPPKFSQDGRTIEQINDQGEILRWRIQRPDLNSFRGTDVPSPNGLTAARSPWTQDGPDGTVEVINLDGQSRTLKLGWRRSNRSLANTFNFDDSAVAVEMITSDNPKEGTPIQISSEKQTAVVVWSVVDGKKLGTLWRNSSDAKLERLISARSRPVFAGIVRPDSEDSDAGHVVIWDSNTLKTKATIHSQHIMAMALSFDGKTVAIESKTPSGDKHPETKPTSMLTLYLTEDGKKLCEFPIASTSTPEGDKRMGFGGLLQRNVERIVFRPDAEFVATFNSSDNAIDIWEIKSGTKMQSLPLTGGHTIFTWAPNDRIITYEQRIIGLVDGRLNVWNAKTGRQLLSRKEYGTTGQSLVYLADENRVLTWGMIGLRIWGATPR